MPCRGGVSFFESPLFCIQQFGTIAKHIVVVGMLCKSQFTVSAFKKEIGQVLRLCACVSLGWLGMNEAGQQQRTCWRRVRELLQLLSDTLHQHRLRRQINPGLGGTCS